MGENNPGGDSRPALKPGLITSLLDMSKCLNNVISKLEYQILSNTTCFT